ncbi:MAG TPA: hypothetical protein VMT12_00540, partial [Syntrophales bacterium]|nr:hypothetical protein [Syntrophales bacterium]
MTEDEVVDFVYSALQSGKGDIDDLNRVRITNSTSDANGLGDLIGTWDFDLFKDDSRWNTHPGFMVDVAGGVRPDIIVRSKSGENRILIEAKGATGLRTPMETSQVVRYFLHLLCTSLQTPNENTVAIRRAILMAAPEEWYSDTKNA